MSMRTDGFYDDAEAMQPLPCPGPAEMRQPTVDETITHIDEAVDDWEGSPDSATWRADMSHEHDPSPWTVENAIPPLIRWEPGEREIRRQQTGDCVDSATALAVIRRWQARIAERRQR